MLTFSTLHFAIALWFISLLAGATSAAPASLSKVCKRTDGATHTTSTMHAFTSTSTDVPTTSPAASETRGQHSHSHVSTHTSSSSATPATPTTGFGATMTSSVHSSGTASASTSVPSGTGPSNPSPSPSDSAPRFVLYTDQSVSSKNGLPDVEDIKGFNVLCVVASRFTDDFLTVPALSALAFYTYSPKDQAEVWAGLSVSDRKAAKKAYNDAGISVILSVFGETTSPTTDGKDPTDLANEIAQFVMGNDLDGIDGQDLFYLSKRMGYAHYELQSTTRTSTPSTTARRRNGSSPSPMSFGRNYPQGGLPFLMHL